jgi:hypothetical protein
MKLDPDLQALSDKIDRLSGLGDKAQFTPEQQGLLDDALRQSQRERHDGVLPTSHFRQELDFFVVCMGYGLVAFAVLVMLRWSTEAPLGGPGVFGLAFLVGVSGALFRAFYARPRTTHARGLILLLSGLVVLGALIALTAAHAIGGVIGIVLGAVFFRAAERRRENRAAPLTDSSAH